MESSPLEGGEEQAGQEDSDWRGRGMPTRRVVSCSVIIMKTWKKARMRVQGVSPRAEQQKGKGQQLLL